MIVWSGDGACVMRGDGARYNPTTGIWSPISQTGAPTARVHHTGVWTGSEMIVWGGWKNPGFVNDGGRYTEPRTLWLFLKP